MEYPIDQSKYELILLVKAAVRSEIRPGYSFIMPSDFAPLVARSYIAVEVRAKGTEELLFVVDIDGLNDVDAMKEVSRQIYEYEGPHE